MGNSHKAEADALRVYIDRAKNLAVDVYQSIAEIMKRHPNMVANFVGLKNPPIMLDDSGGSKVVVVDEVEYNEEYNFIQVSGSSSEISLTTLFYNDGYFYPDLSLALNILDRLIKHEEFLFNANIDIVEGNE